MWWCLKTETGLIFSIHIFRSEETFPKSSLELFLSHVIGQNCVTCPCPNQSLERITELQDCFGPIKMQWSQSRKHVAMWKMVDSACRRFGSQSKYLTGNRRKVTVELPRRRHAGCCCCCKSSPPIMATATNWTRWVLLLSSKAADLHSNECNLERSDWFSKRRLPRS